MSMSGAKWVEMTPKEKEPFEKMHLDEVKLHDSRMEQREKHGFFKFQDGTKSTDPANAKLVKKEKKVSKGDSKEED